MANISVPIVVDLDMDVIIEKFKEEGWMPVVRCKECKWFEAVTKNGVPKGYGFCPILGTMLDKDWFCADGESNADTTLPTC